MTVAICARFGELNFETMPDSEKFSLMDELTRENDGALSAATPSVPEPTKPVSVPAIDTPTVSAAVSDQTTSAFAAGDVYGNDVDSFRIDSVSPEGNIAIRFRSLELGGKLDFFGSMAVFLKSVKDEARHHEGEWFFGSPNELSAFISENKYTFKKHGGKQGD